jgi:hypothetical protein
MDNAGISCHLVVGTKLAEVWLGWVLSVVVGIVYSGRAGREVGGCIDPIGGVDQGEGGSGRVGDPRDSPQPGDSMCLVTENCPNDSVASSPTRIMLRQLASS